MAITQMNPVYRSFGLSLKQLKFRTTGALFIFEIIFLTAVYIWWTQPRPNLITPLDVLPHDATPEDLVAWYTNVCSAQKLLLNTSIPVPTSVKPLCPCVPDSLLGRLELNTDSLLKNGGNTIYGRSYVSESYKDIAPGGAWKPKDCVARQKVVIIIPFRDRESQLKVFLNHIHSILKRQLLDYRIVVVEQLLPDTFNKAALMNVGYLEAKKLYSFDCFIFHDVDMLAEDDRNMYTCLDKPRHIGSHVNIFKYEVPYGGLIGGVMGFTSAQFEQVNGFSNEFWGWGGEDDDLNKRLQAQNMTVLRFPGSVARFTMIKHGVDKRNPRNPHAESAWEYKPEHYQRDGLTNVRYVCVQTELRPLYTWIYVSLPEPTSNARL